MWKGRCECFRVRQHSPHRLPVAGRHHCAKGWKAHCVQTEQKREGATGTWAWEEGICYGLAPMAMCWEHWDLHGDVRR